MSASKQACDRAEAEAEALHHTIHPKTSQVQLTCCRASASLALCLPLMCLSTKSLATNILVLSVLPHLQRQLGTLSAHRQHFLKRWQVTHAQAFTACITVPSCTGKRTQQPGPLLTAYTCRSAARPRIQTG